MRSRYSAFALGLGEYLYDTLAEEHPDREVNREDSARELSRVRERQRFLGLTILDAPPPARTQATRSDAARNKERGEPASGAPSELATSPAGDAEVLFFARVFERGADRSFAELSRFVLEGEPPVWRYASGVLVARARLPADLSKLHRAALLELAAGR